MWSESSVWERSKAVAMIVVGMVGVLVNVASLILIRRKERRVSRLREVTMFLTLLKMLALSDLLVVIGCPLMYALPQLWFVYNDQVYPRLLPFLLPIVQMAIMASVYSTVAMSLERFGCIRITARPRIVAIVNQRNFRHCVVGLLLVPVLFYLPRFFEFRCVEESFELELDCNLLLVLNNTDQLDDTNTDDDETNKWSLGSLDTSHLVTECLEEGQQLRSDKRISETLSSLKLESTWLRNHPLYYTLYCVLLNTLVMSVVPLVSLLYFNVVTVNALRRTRQTTTATTRTMSNATLNVHHAAAHLLPHTTRRCRPLLDQRRHLRLHMDHLEASFRRVKPSVSLGGADKKSLDKKSLDGTDAAAGDPAVGEVTEAGGRHRWPRRRGRRGRGRSAKTVSEGSGSGSRSSQLWCRGRVHSESRCDLSPRRRNDESLRRRRGRQPPNGRGRVREKARSRIRHEAKLRRVSSAPDEIFSTDITDEPTLPPPTRLPTCSVPSATVVDVVFDHGQVGHHQWPGERGGSTPLISYEMSSALRAGERRLTFLAIRIVWLFLFSHFWKLVPTFYEAYNLLFVSNDVNTVWPNWLLEVQDLSHTLIVFNSAINFLCYCSWPSKWPSLKRRSRLRDFY